MFTFNSSGMIVYKAFGNTTYTPPDRWEVKKGSILEEVANSNLTEDCGCGVNVGTEEWAKENYPGRVYWRCLILNKYLPFVVVPYNCKGKIRTEYLVLLEKII